MAHIDTHNHLDLPAFDADRDAVLARARAVGVVGHLVAGVDPAGWVRQRALASAVPGIRWSAGLHPQVAAGMEPAEIDDALAGLPEAFLGEHAACAVGETGLDRLFVEPETLPAQRHAFRAQLALARELDRPVVLHIVRTHGETLEVLERDGLPPSGGHVHSFSGSAELALRYARMGLKIGFVGSVCRPNARKLHRAAAALPPEAILIETDAPDQAPPGGDRRNEPARLLQVAAAVAEHRGCAVDEVLAWSDRNAEALFGVFDDRPATAPDTAR